MATVQRFQDLKAWQLARALNRTLYTASGQGAFGRDYALRDQIRRASISISSNVAEGFERRSPADFARFLTIAKASAAEVHSQLYLARDLDYIDTETFDVLASQVGEISRTIGALLRYLHTQDGRTAHETPAPYDTLSEL